jgi:TRAP-type C4-dicarboxylate transport system permease small subunit
MLRQAEKGLQAIDKVMVVISWAVTLFITFMIVIDVFLRFLFNKPLPASWEISEVVMPYIIFFALSQALAVGAHVQVTIITNLFGPKGRRVCEIIATLICLIVCVPLTYWSWLHFWSSYRIGEEILAAIWIPWWLGKFAMPVGLGAFTLRYFLNLLNLLMMDRMVLIEGGEIE